VYVIGETGSPWRHFRFLTVISKTKEFASKTKEFATGAAYIPARG